MSKILRTTAFSVITILVIVMAIATFVEKYHGTAFVSSEIYGTWWFSALWAIAAITGIIYFFSTKKKLYNALLHCSLVVILAGAFATFTMARHGSVHLRQGVATDSVMLESGEKVKMPFTLTLDKFNVEYHAGTMMPSDYSSVFTVDDNGQQTTGSVSMNKTYSHKGVRLFQTSYDNDMQGSRLTYNEDRIGMPVTYVGYVLLFIAMVWMLITPNGGFRRLLKDTRLRRGLTIITLTIAATTVNAAETLSNAEAKAFGEMLIERNGRICPVQTVAIDFTKKLSGKSSYNGYSAEQVMTGYLFYGDSWSKEKVIRVKNRDIRKVTGLPEHASLDDFFTRGYILAPYVEAYYQGEKNGINKAAADLDDRIMLIMSLRQGVWLKMFPVKDGSSVIWCSPVDNLPEETDSIQSLFIRNAFRLLNDTGIQPNDEKAFIETVGQMRKYQDKYGENSVPSNFRIKAELLYNRIPFTDWLYRIDLTMGIVLIILLVRSMLNRKSGKERVSSIIRRIGMFVLIASFIVLTAGLTMRYIISHRLPLGNGYETMLALAWCIQLIGLLTIRKMRYLLSFSLLLSGFFLLVSAISQMDPQITPLMPVLSSPLLSIHVSLIMMAYALLSFTFICSIIALTAVVIKGRNDNAVAERCETLQLVSKMFLYPALTLLTMGIFIGAVWANQSWGRYWGWDPKETWALINLLLYAIAVHSDSIPFLRRPIAYHIYIGLAFLTVLMTYIGVNYFLGGMHSYA